jgi:ATP-dependent DNA helicase RecG
MFICANSGYTSAMMAPTEILANQHYETLCALFKPFDIGVALITGSMTAKERNAVKEQMSDLYVMIPERCSDAAL